MALDTRIISVPVEVPATMSDEEAQRVAREAFAMQMYAQGK